MTKDFNKPPSGNKPSPSGNKPSRDEEANNARPNRRSRAELDRAWEHGTQQKHADYQRQAPRGQGPQSHRPSSGPNAQRGPRRYADDERERYQSRPNNNYRSSSSYRSDDEERAPRSPGAYRRNPDDNRPPFNRSAPRDRKPYERGPQRDADNYQVREDRGSRYGDRERPSGSPSRNGAPAGNRPYGQRPPQGRNPNYRPPRDDEDRRGGSPPRYPRRDDYEDRRSSPPPRYPRRDDYEDRRGGPPRYQRDHEDRRSSSPPRYQSGNQGNHRAGSPPRHAGRDYEDRRSSSPPRYQNRDQDNRRGGPPPRYQNRDQRPRGRFDRENDYEQRRPKGRPGHGFLGSGYEVARGDEDHTRSKPRYNEQERQGPRPPRPNRPPAPYKRDENHSPERGNFPGRRRSRSESEPYEPKHAQKGRFAENPQSAKPQSHPAAEEEELLHEQIEITHDDASGTTTIKSQRKANPPKTEPEPEAEAEPQQQAKQAPASSSKQKRKKQRQLFFPSQKGFLWPLPAASQPEPALAQSESES